MYQLEEKVLNALVQYLSTKPYAEVFQFFEVLKGLKKVEEPQPIEAVEVKPEEK